MIDQTIGILMKHYVASVRRAYIHDVAISAGFRVKVYLIFHSDKADRLKQGARTASMSCS